MDLSEAARILNVDTTSHPDIIKKKYRKLAKLYHPDVNSHKEASSLYFQVNEAYQCFVSRGSIPPEEKSKDEIYQEMKEAYNEQQRLEALKPENIIYQKAIENLIRQKAKHDKEKADQKLLHDKRMKRFEFFLLYFTYAFYLRLNFFCDR